MKYWSISSQVLIEEAESLGLQTEIINRDKNLFRVWNDKKSILFKGTDCGVNSSLGLKIANDKELTYDILSRAGLPLAKTVYISTSQGAGSFDDTGFVYPLIIKPLDGAHGDGVVMNLQSRQQVIDALETALQSHQRMIVQEQVEGDEYRILVFEGEVIFAARRAYPTVVGDGVHTISELIYIENDINPLRGDGYEKPLSHIKIDDETIRQVQDEGYKMNDVLLVGKKIIVRRNSNVGTGGILESVIDILDEKYIQVACEASKISQLPFVGVDILAKSIDQYDEQCCILEINATCGIGGHREVTEVNTGRVLLTKLFNL